MSVEVIVPGRFIEPSDPVGLQLGLEGWFTLEAVRNGRVVRSHTFKENGGLAQVGPFQNLILNLGLDKFASENQSTMIRFFKVGTGTAPPAVTNTQLANQVGGNVAANGAVSNPGAPPDYHSRMICTGLSSIGQFGTVNLTEVGIGATGNATLFSRALIVDSVGSPVAFPISSEEQLRLSYELRLYPPLADANFTVNVAGTRNVVVRALGVSNYSSWGVLPPQGSVGSVNAQPSDAVSNLFRTGDLGLITASAPQGSAVSSAGSSLAVTPYSTGSYKLAHRQSWPSTSNNSPTLRTHEVRYGCCAFQVQYDPPLAKTSDQTMYLDYELSWARR